MSRTVVLEDYAERLAVRVSEVLDIPVDTAANFIIGFAAGYYSGVNGFSLYESDTAFLNYVADNREWIVQKFRG